MNETWFDWCIKAPAPRPGYEGYPSKPLRTLSEILYIVNHSAEGWEAYLKQGYRPGEPASWAFSNCQDGDMYQHFPLEAITYTSGGKAQNIQGLGVEHEGVKGQLLNQKQIDNDLRLWNSVAAVCPNLRPQAFGQGYREHSELTGGATTCPNGRIQSLYDSLAEGDDFMSALSDDEQRRMLATLDAMNTIQDGVPGTLTRIEERLALLENGAQLTAKAIAKEVADEESRRLAG